MVLFLCLCFSCSFGLTLLQYTTIQIKQTETFVICLKCAIQTHIDVCCLKLLLHLLILLVCMVFIFLFVSHYSFFLSFSIYLSIYLHTPHIYTAARCLSSFFFLPILPLAKANSWNVRFYFLVVVLFFFFLPSLTHPIKQIPKRYVLTEKRRSQRRRKRGEERGEERSEFGGFSESMHG